MHAAEIRILVILYFGNQAKGLGLGHCSPMEARELLEFMRIGTIHNDNGRWRFKDSHIRIDAGLPILNMSFENSEEAYNAN